MMKFDNDLGRPQLRVYHCLNHVVLGAFDIHFEKLDRRMAKSGGDVRQGHCGNFDLAWLVIEVGG